jgi:hypothetical protein
MEENLKQLLLKDLCARLPYEVQGITSEGVVSPLLSKGEADWDILTSLNYRIVKHGWKPYLRPMSSMTEEESEEYKSITESFIGFNIGENTDWLNAHHFDYRGIIFKGLAIEAPKNMYNTKTE